MVTFITFGSLSVIAGLLALILPETGDEDLPDTVFDAENLGEASRKLSRKTDYDDNTLVRSEDCGATQYSEVRFFPDFFPLDHDLKVLRVLIFSFFAVVLKR